MKNQANDWHILMVEDDEDDWLITRTMLSEARDRQVRLDWARNYAEGLNLCFTNCYDAILVDYDLGGQFGIDWIKEVIEKGCTKAIILYTGRGSREVDLQAMEAGATMYLTKGESNPLLLERVIRYAIERKQSSQDLANLNRALKNANEALEHRVEERTLALRSKNAELEKASQLLDRMFEAMYIGIALLDRDLNFVRVNRTYALFDGHEPSFFPGKNHFVLYPNPENETLFRNVIKSGEPLFVNARPFVYAAHPERGVTYWDWDLQPIVGDSGQVEWLLFTLHNVTDRIIQATEI